LPSEFITERARLPPLFFAAPLLKTQPPYIFFFVCAPSPKIACFLLGFLKAISQSAVRWSVASLPGERFPFASFRLSFVFQAPLAWLSLVSAQQFSKTRSRDAFFLFPRESAIKPQAEIVLIRTSGPRFPPAALQIFHPKIKNGILFSTQELIKRTSFYALCFSFGFFWRPADP